MLEKIIRFFEETLDSTNIVYSMKRASAYILGKSGVGLLAGASIGMLSGFFGFGGGEAEFFTKTALAVGGVASVSGYLVQTDFLHSRHNLLERYREEVGSLLDKAPDKVQEADIELVARGDFKKGIPANPALRRELKNTWLQRNVGIALSATISALTYGAVHVLDHYYGGGMIGGSFEHLVEHGVVEAFREHPGDFLTALGRNGVMGLVTYHTLKTPAHWALSDVLGIDENTVNDRVSGIKRTLGHGREVKPEQVLALFIHAHPDIEEQVKAEYGMEFDQMTRQQKQAMIKVVEQYMDIEQVTDDINKGRMRPEELLFSAYGQSSGMEIGEDGKHVHHGNVLDNMWQGLTALTGGFTKTADSPEHTASVSRGLAEDMPGQTTVTVHTPDVDHAHLHLENEQEEPGRKQSFVAKVGRSVDRSADGLSHVERLERSSNQQVVVTPTS